MRKGVSWTTTGEPASFSHTVPTEPRQLRSPSQPLPPPVLITSGWALVRWVVGFTEEAGLSDEQLQEVYERAKADTVRTCPRGLPHRQLRGFLERPFGA